MIMAQLFQKRSIENPAVPINADTILSSWNAGFRSRSGIDVTPARALEFGPIWQGVTLLGGDIGKTPCITYEQQGRARRRAREHPVFTICRKNVGGQTANLFFSAMVSHAALFGNAYAFIRRGGPGFRPTRLEFVHSDYIRPRYEAGVKFYTYRPPDNKSEERRIPANNIFHLPGTVLDQLGGLSLVRYARDVIGTHLAASGYSDDFFSNNGVPHGFFEHPDRISEGAQRRFINSIMNRHGGPGNQFKPGVLEEGMKWVATGISPKDALLVDLMNVGPRQAANFLNLPPHKVGDDSRTAYNSLEAEQQSYLESSLGVWFSKLEFEANDKLFRTDEKDSFYCEFLVDARLRSDTKTRFETYALAIQYGVMSPNEARERENLNPYDGGDEIKVYFSDGSQSDEPDDQQGEAEEEPAPSSDDREYKVRIANRDLLFDRLQSMNKRLVNSARTAAKKPERFGEFVNNLRANHGTVMQDALRPVCQLTGAMFGRDSEKMLGEIVDATIDEAASRFLMASECQEEELADRVTNVIGDLTSRASDLATGIFED